MAERKATNKYYPPDWDPSKGSINKHVGQHPLRDRARKLKDGILIVRFELPFPIWCEGCSNHIGMGVRYNAEKSKIGNYYSTPILSFRMKCHLCSHWIEIHTDPKNGEYVVVSGAKRKVEEYNPEDAGVIALRDDDEKEKLESNALYRLETQVIDKRKADEGKVYLSKLQDLNEKLWADPFTVNQQLRQKFREEKKVLGKQKMEADAIRDQYQLPFDVLPEAEEDKVKAKLVEFDDPTLKESKRRKIDIVASSIFEKPNASSSLGSTTPSTSTKPRPIDSIKRITKLAQAQKDPFSVMSSSSTSSTTVPGPSSSLSKILVRPKGTSTSTKNTLALVDYGESDED